MEIKHSNWFAAGPEVQRALMALSDGAFRLYFHVCLNASRKSGRISVSYAALAQSLGRSRRSIATHIEELRRLGICQVHPAINQHKNTEIEVCDDYWPYTRSCRDAEPSENTQYLSLIKDILAKRACVQTVFSGADEKYAAELWAHRVPIEQIERAIALGCCRKYVSMLNGTASDIIFSFAYFREVVEEVCNPNIPSGYWDYVMPEVEYLEKKWTDAQRAVASADSASATAPKSEETR